MTTLDYKKLAELLYPNAKDISFYEKKYPKRNIKENAEVLRFAPSPTGYLHIGGFFQAVLDTSLAKQTGGISYLRIEDTDQNRQVGDAVDVIISTLNNYNIHFDEGVCAVDKELGSYGPYTQSNRTDIYHSFAKKLVELGYAYPCFCTKTDDDADAITLGETNKALLGYSGVNRKCNNLTIKQVEENLKSDKPFVIRFRSQSKSLDEKIEGTDLIRGTISLQRRFNDDVLIKSNGIPVYHFAHVVDDYLMGTTIVVRGAEWLASLPLHIDLWKAFNFKPTKYLHTMLLGKHEGSSWVKFSKRKHPDANMTYYAEQGYPKQSLIEYVYVLINSGFEIWRRENLSQPCINYPIDIAKMNASEAVWDLAKLDSISRIIISKMTKEEVYNEIVLWAEKFDKDFYDILKNDKDKWLAIFNIDRESERPRADISKWSEVKNYFSYFIQSPKVVFENAKLSSDVLTKYLNIYNVLDDKETWWNKIKTLAEQMNFCTDSKLYKQSPEKYNGNLSDFAKIIRIHATGRENTPDLYEILKILHKN